MSPETTASEPRPRGDRRHPLPRRRHGRDRRDSGHPGAPLGQAPMAYVLWTPAAAPRSGRPELAQPRPLRALLPATPRRCSTRCSTSPATTCRSRSCGASASSARRPPATPSTATRPGWRPPPGRSARGSATPSAWRSPRPCSPPASIATAAPLFDHRVWAIASDGDMMEGVSDEAASLAGHLRLGKLNVLYDANTITIDGPTDLAFSEDVGGRFKAYGWHVQHVADGNDLDALEAAIDAARPRRPTGRRSSSCAPPSARAARTRPGHARGPRRAARGPTRCAPPRRTSAGRSSRPSSFRTRRGRRSQRRASAAAGSTPAGTSCATAGRPPTPELAAELERRLAGRLPDGWHGDLPRFEPGGKPIATRGARGKVLNALAAAVPELVGGSADLGESNQTAISEAATSPRRRPRRPQRPLRRARARHGRGAQRHRRLQGVAAPFGGTFLIFSDYLRPAMRLAALMQLGVTYVFTHDSIFLGEDGPTHQPVSAAARPARDPEHRGAAPGGRQRDRRRPGASPSAARRPDRARATRQNLPILAEVAARARRRRAPAAATSSPTRSRPSPRRSSSPPARRSPGARGAPAAGGRGRRHAGGVLPSWELFAARTRGLPRGGPAAPPDEAAGDRGGHPAWLGALRGAARATVIGQESFGASGQAEDLARHFGYTVEEVVHRVHRLLGKEQ